VNDSTQTREAYLTLILKSLEVALRTTKKTRAQIMVDLLSADYLVEYWPYFDTLFQQLVLLSGSELAAENWIYFLLNFMFKLSEDVCVSANLSSFFQTLEVLMLREIRGNKRLISPQMMNFWMKSQSHSMAFSDLFSVLLRQQQPGGDLRESRSSTSRLRLSSNSPRRLLLFTVPKRVLLDCLMEVREKTANLIGQFDFMALGAFFGSLVTKQYFDLLKSAAICEQFQRDLIAADSDIFAESEPTRINIILNAARSKSQNFVINIRIIDLCKALKFGQSSRRCTL
jgi:hypothetical protein